MSKVLKIIVNLVVLIAIAIAAALLVPPFLGVDTVMNDNTGTETNLPTGSVAYGKSVGVEELEQNDKIIYNEGSSTYVYEIEDMDTSAGSYTVKDPYSSSGESSVTLQKSVPKVVVVVPFIGYAAIALQTKEGLIVIGLGIVFLIILFILSELWRKDRYEDEDEDEEEDDSEEDEDEDDEEEELSFRERRRLKKEEKRRRREAEEEEYEEEYEEDDEEEEELSRKERRRLKKEEKRRRKLEKKGLLDEEEEDEEEEAPPLKEEPEASDPQGYDAAMKEAMSSIAMGVAQVNGPEQVPDATVVMPDKEELEQAIEQQAAGESAAEGLQGKDGLEQVPGRGIDTDSISIEETPLKEMFSEEIPSEEIPEEMPVDVNTVPKAPSVQELLAKAQAAGEQPEVKEDKDNEVTLLDYSDIL